jgi:hypothetical protein
MTEDAYLKCSDLDELLTEFGTDHLNYRRKFRLLAVACCQPIAGKVTDVAHKHALAVAESFADGLIELEDLRRVRSTAFNSDLDQSSYALAAIRATLRDSPVAAAREAAHQAIQEVWKRVKGGWETAPARKAEAKRHQCALFRDIFGNPFRPVWLDSRWGTCDVVGLARGIDEERAFDRLPVLADALMDAGCDDEQMLDHCRGGGPHVPGCWVVDLVLGKES